MEYIRKDKILEHNPDVLQAVREKYGLDGPGRMAEAMDILNEWIQKQTHFRKKDFNFPNKNSEFLNKLYCPKLELESAMAIGLPPVTLLNIHGLIVDILVHTHQWSLLISPLPTLSGIMDPYYLECTLISRKGSIERAKVLLDRYCTMRTLMPQFFGRVDVSKDIGNIRELMHRVSLPRPTKDNYRVDIIKTVKDNFKTADMMNYYKFSVVLNEYMKANDYSNGLIVVIDLSEVNIINLVANIDIIHAKQMSDIQMEAFGTRVSNIYVVSDSKVVNLIINVMKQVMSPKITGRIEVKKNISELHDVIDKRILPKDYGGEERSIRELSDLWVDVLSSEEHLQFLEEMCGANTDESFRPHDKFNEQYAGMAGTFRALRVD